MFFVFQYVIFASPTGGEQHRSCVRGGRSSLPDAQADDDDRTPQEVQVQEDRIAEGRADAGPGQRSEEDQPAQAEDQGHDVPLPQNGQVNKHKQSSQPLIRLLKIKLRQNNQFKKLLFQSILANLVIISSNFCYC